MSNADRIARLQTRYDEAIAELDRVNATEPYDNDAAGDAYFQVTEAYAKLGAAESTTDFLRSGWGSRASVRVHKRIIRVDSIALTRWVVIVRKKALNPEVG